MPTLVSTPGVANANTYASLVEYKSYIEIRRPQPTWAAVALAGTTIDNELIIDLISSCTLLNISFDWTGTISTSNLSETLLWPRAGMYYRNGKAIPDTVNPSDLKTAQCELAVQVHSLDLISDSEIEKQNLSRVKAGSVEVEFQERDKSSLESADVRVRLAGAAYNYISDSVPSAVRRLLVPTWYREAEGVGRGWMFEVLGV